MSYNPNIPEPEPSPATQQPDLKTNFSQFAAVFASSSGGVNYNHTAINAGNQGKHEAIILQDNVTDPLVEDDFVALYNKSGQIFARIQEFLPNGVPNTPEQLTYSAVNTAGPQFQSFLPGGYLIYFGSISGSTSSSANITNTITLSPAPSGNIIPIAATNTMTAFGTPQPCAIAANVLNSSQFTITMQSPWNSGGAQSYNLNWTAIATI